MCMLGVMSHFNYKNLGDFFADDGVNLSRFFFRYFCCFFAYDTIRDLRFCVVDDVD